MYKEKIKYKNKDIAAISAQKFDYLTRHMVAVFVKNANNILK